MAVGADELARWGDEVLADRRIGTDLYCARCGYNLRTLTYLGRCPECGSQYSARPPVMKGIFTADMLRFPLEELFWTSVCLSIGAACLFLGAWPPGEGRLLIGVVFGALGACYVHLLWKRLVRYVRLLEVYRRLRDEDSDDWIEV
ncbi:MAG: hypothetical protein ACE5GE_01255 [Phycisphaerae bacterium]